MLSVLRISGAITALLAGILTLTVGDNRGGDNFGCRPCVPILIVKENVRTESRQNLCFTDTAEKECFIYTYIPLAQCFDGSFVGGGISGSYKCSSDWCGFLIRKLGLNMGYCFQEISKRAFLHGNVGLGPFMLSKGIQALMLVNPFRVGTK